MKHLVLFLLALGSMGNTIAQSKQLDELVNAYAKVNQFNGAVLVAHGNRILYENAFGVKDAARQTNNDTNTLFRIYSVTKTFTATVIFKLIEEKKLSLDDRLSKFYPDFPKGDSITIQHLLMHKSGIYDYARGNDMKDQSEASFIRFLSAKPLEFSPGKGWGYSNSGYWLLGYIIQKVTGITYEEAVRRYIFLPCKMDHSGFDFKTLQHKNKATGYELFASGLKKEAEDLDPPGPYAAGAIYSTVGDLYRYYKAQQAFKLISRQSLNIAWTPDTINKHYGFGWQLDSIHGRKAISHGGGGPGFKSILYFIPQDSICVVLLNNNEVSNLDVLNHSICNLLYGKKYNIPIDIAVDSFKLQRYVGHYVFAPTFSLDITVEGGKLVAQPVGQPKHVMLAEKENYFYAIEHDVSLEFLVDESGVCNEAVLRQRGDEHHGKRQ
ncbi:MULTISPECIES: serine hydrolase [Niastella]|uniref:Serine hydrolase n=1 Tax=Niastella soli TaxID=2821487 RepID=A0ABS3YLD2_9BACT|nr:serine hydrolase [Niastella soli]MBO9198693.1 serine hydrolase [Niastella soli]